MSAVQFTKDRKALNLIHQIAARASALYAEHGTPRSVLDISMDLSACHVTNPLRLADLHAADNFNLLHDVGGIDRHLNRETGEIEGHFSPRFSVGGVMRA